MCENLPHNLNRIFKQKQKEKKKGEMQKLYSLEIGSALFAFAYRRNKGFRFSQDISLLLHFVR